MSAEKPKGTFRSFNDTFRREAVDLLISSGRPLNAVAKELGVTANSLRSWRNKHAPRRGAGASAPAEPRRGQAVSASPTRPAAEDDLLARVRQLQQENEYLRRQREILKKAMSILGQDPQTGLL